MEKHDEGAAADVSSPAGPGSDDKAQRTGLRIVIGAVIVAAIVTLGAVAWTMLSANTKFDGDWTCVEKGWKVETEIHLSNGTGTLTLPNATYEIAIDRDGEVTLKDKPNMHLGTFVLEDGKNELVWTNNGNVYHFYPSSTTTSVPTWAQ